MSTPVNIVDGEGFSASIIKPKSKEHGVNAPGILAYTHPADEYDGINKVFFNQSKGVEMAVDGGGTAPALVDAVYTDAAGWATAALSGTWDFASAFSAAGWPPDGTVSIDGTGTADSNQAEFTRGSDLALSGSYDNLVGAIYLTSWAGSGKALNIEARDSSDVLVGNSVNIGAYIDTGLLNTTQNFRIPLSDMGLSTQTIRKLVITVVKGGGAAQDFYLDNIKIQDGGAGYTYSIEPNGDKTLFVDYIKIRMERAYTATGSGGGLPITMTGFLGSGSLTNGILAGLSTRGVFREQDAAIFRNLREWWRFPQIDAKSIVCTTDGTNTSLEWALSFEAVGGLRVRPSLEERLVYVVQDDLSSFTTFQIWANCREVLEV